MKKITAAIAFLLLVSSFTFAQAVKKDVIAKTNKTKVVNSTQNTNTATYDFTTGSDKYYGQANGAKELQSGVWGMIAGDSNGSGIVSSSDKDPINSELNSNGYYSSDINMSGIVTSSDKDLVNANNNMATQVP